MMILLCQVPREIKLLGSPEPANLALTETFQILQ